jgi:hypothetical protein
MKPHGSSVDLDLVDLGGIANFLNSVHPQHTRCELVKMLAALAPVEGTTCSLCKPTKYPACQFNYTADPKSLGHMANRQ